MSGSPWRMRALLAAGIALLTIAVYASVGSFEFLNYDDNVYVTDNAHVKAGLTAENLSGVWTYFDAGNWHPLTLLSHMLDVQLFGIEAGGPHVENVVLHVANALLLFWLLAAATGKVTPSALVAALFAVHPLNVQSVAWIAERKSLLSTTFWFVALIVFVRHRRAPSRTLYALMLAATVIALLFKPMAVTIPLTFVLLDYWPLGTKPEGPSRLAGTARELWPFVLACLVCGVMTLIAQKSVAAVQNFQSYPWSYRFGNGIVAYVWYLKELVWPTHLAVFYPHPMGLLTLQAVMGALIELAILAGLVIMDRKVGAVVMGALWYAGTLLPVAGFIQVGSQAYADRYAYIPLIGVFIALVWGALRLLEGRSLLAHRAAALAALVWIVGLAGIARQQVSYWRDSVSLFQHAIDVVPNNALAHSNLGMAFVSRGRMSEALDEFQKASAIAPWDSDAHANAGNALRALGRPAEAVTAYEQALDDAPEDASTHFNLATALLDLGRKDDAVAHLKRAVELDPRYAKARFLLGTLLARGGQLDPALEQFREVLRLNPEYPNVAEWVKRIEELKGP